MNNKLFLIPVLLLIALPLVFASDYTDSHGYTTGSYSGSFSIGAWVEVTEAVSITGVEKYASTGATEVKIYDASDDSLLATQSYSGDIATLSTPLDVSVGQVLYIVNDANTYWGFSGHGGSLETDHFDWLGRVYWTGSAWSTTGSEIDEIVSIFSDAIVSGDSPSLETNLSSYANVTTDFSVGINLTNFDSASTCGIETDNGLIYCSNETVVDDQTSNTCYVPSSFIREDVLYSPFCYNSSLTVHTDNESIFMDTHNLKINATSALSGSYIEDVYIKVNNITYQTEGNNSYAYGTGTQEVQIWADGYVIEYDNITFSSTPQNLTYDLYTANLIRVDLYDINGNDLTDVNITLSITGNTTQANTGNDSYYYNTFDAGVYTVVVSKTGYSSSTYYITLNNGSYINLATYLDLEENTLSRTFTVEDINNGEKIENALLYFYRTIDTELELITQGYSDYNGQVLAFLDPTQNYLLRVTHPSYLVKELSFTPTLSSYTVKVGVEYVPEYESIYDDITYNFEPTYSGILNQDQYYTANFSIVSSAGQLEYWGLSVNNDGDIYTINITDSPSGSQTGYGFTIPSISSGYTSVVITYFFKSGEESEAWTTTKTYYAYPVISSNNTIIEAFSNLTSQLEDDSGSGSGDWIQYIMMGFITIALMGVLVWLFRIRDPIIIGSLTITLMAFWAYVGWFAWWLWALIAIPIYMILAIDIKSRVG